jgi:lambda family phage portal protein
MFNWLRRRLRPQASTGWRRSFEAAKSSRLLDDWNLSAVSIDKDVEGALLTLRTRSRDLCQNNDYGKRYLELLVSNVVGPAGIRLQMKVKNRRADGSQVIDKPANDIIEAAWSRWCSRPNCTTGRRLSFTELLALVMRAVPRDGEALVRVVRNFDNPFRFALQPLPVDCLDHAYTDSARRIRMGVETNAWGEPVAYHVLTSNPADQGWPTAGPGSKRERIAASEILHVYRPDHLVQTRGFPWTAASMRRLHIAGKYEEAELVAARVGASNMGFFMTGDGNAYGYDDKDAAGNPITEVAPGRFETLPKNIVDFKQFDPQHPTTAFPDFMKSILRGAASGLNVSYISLANDLADTSYASGRQGLLEERSWYMQIQGWLIEACVQPVFDAWLPIAIAAGEVNLPLSDIARFRASAGWQPRRWSWVDPRSDMDAAQKAVALGINSRTRLAGDLGADLEDIFDELAAEHEAAEALEISIDPAAKPAPAAATEGAVNE